MRLFASLPALCGPRWGSARRYAGRLARRSLGLLGVSLLASSCLVVGSPDFTDEPTKPVLTSTKPPTSQLLCLKKNNNQFDPQEFTIEFDSYDAGQDLRAALLFDYGVDHDGVPYGPFVPEGDVGAGVGEATLKWTIPLTEPVGTCHSLTMIVLRNRYGEAPYTWCPTDDQYVTATWFVALADDNEVCDFSDCPSKVNNPTPFYCPDSLKTPAGGAP